MAGLFAASTAFSTLALGEHYLIDLVVAFPFAIAVQASCAAALPLRRTERLRPLLAGGTLVAGWLVLLWMGLPLFAGRPWLSWMSVALSVGLPVLWERRLAFAAMSRRPIGIRAPEAALLIPAGVESAAS